MIGHTDFFQRLVLGLREQEVRNNGVGHVGADVNQEVLPTEFLETAVIRLRQVSKCNRSPEASDWAYTGVT